jgi:hypothetical protein|tara:strand:+ start:264 stop:488 length:225 start_codon:yes stop_codon:yes gene_type:complete
MDRFIYVLTILILFIAPLNANEKKDCSDIKKFSKSYLVCKSNNLKKGIKDKTSKTGNPFKKIIEYQKNVWSKKN